MYFYNWRDFFPYSDSERKLESRVRHNFCALDQTVVLISLK